MKCNILLFWFWIDIMLIILFLISLFWEEFVCLNEFLFKLLFNLGFFVVNFIDFLGIRILLLVNMLLELIKRFRFFLFSLVWFFILDDLIFIWLLLIVYIGIFWFFFICFEFLVFIKYFFWFCFDLLLEFKFFFNLFLFIMFIMILFVLDGNFIVEDVSEFILFWDFVLF